MRASIITPTLNCIDHIGTCVENVRAQGDAVLEHIVVDGGSHDGTAEFLRDIARTDPKIRFIPGPDRGQSDALNKGSAAAIGDVIGILNSDDSYEPGAAREALAILRKAATPTFVAGNCLIHYPDRRYDNRPRDLRLESLLLDWDYYEFPVNPAAYFYHRQVHDIVGGYDVGYHYEMDFDFILRCAGRVGMRYVDRHWGNFHMRPGCKSYEDEDPDARRHALVQRHIGTLTARQRRTMARIRRNTDLIRSTRRILKKSSLLSAINRRLVRHSAARRDRRSQEECR